MLLKHIIGNKVDSLLPEEKEEEEGEEDGRQKEEQK